MREVWEDIAGYDGRYQVSIWGRIRNEKGEIMKPYVNEKGYLKVTLQDGKTRDKVRISRIVAETFIPNYDHKPEVNHKDGDKMNNSVTNLEWVTRGENMGHYKDNESHWHDQAHAAAVARYHFPESEA